MVCHLFPTFLYQLLLDQTNGKPTAKYRIASKDPPYPQTNIHFLPRNRSPSSNHRFDTNHPHPTSTTQKRRPICHGSHQAHGHRFLNQNPPYLQTHRHLLPENRGRAPSSDHPFVNLEIKEIFLHWALPQIIESPPSSLEY